jgi:hypothetical protein
MTKSSGLLIIGLVAVAVLCIISLSKYDQIQRSYDYWSASGSCQQPNPAMRALWIISLLAVADKIRPNPAVLCIISLSKYDQIQRSYVLSVCQKYMTKSSSLLIIGLVAVAVLCIISLSKYDQIQQSYDYRSASGSCQRPNPATTVLWIISLLAVADKIRPNPAVLCIISLSKYDQIQRSFIIGLVAVAVLWIISMLAVAVKIRPNPAVLYSLLAVAVNEIISLVAVADKIRPNPAVLCIINLSKYDQIQRSFIIGLVAVAVLWIISMLAVAVKIRPNPAVLQSACGSCQWPNPAMTVLWIISLVSGCWQNMTKSNGLLIIGLV